MRFAQWYEDFSRFAEDLYPRRYSRDYVRLLAEMSEEVQSLARQKSSTIVAHNYQYPELQEVADTVGDSLGLSLYVVFSDDSRISQMFTALNRAGKNQQVIIFTCRTRTFATLGGRSLSIEHSVQ